MPAPVAVLNVCSAQPTRHGFWLAQRCRCGAKSKPVIIKRRAV